MFCQYGFSLSYSQRIERTKFTFNYKSIRKKPVPSHTDSPKGSSCRKFRGDLCAFFSFIGSNKHTPQKTYAL